MTTIVELNDHVTINRDLGILPYSETKYEEIIPALEHIQQYSLSKEVKRASSTKPLLDKTP